MKHMIAGPELRREAIAAAKRNLQDSLRGGSQIRRAVAHPREYTEECRTILDKLETLDEWQREQGR